ncbi:hypothetical protein BJ912DRAFT_1061920 [Pholiota molesta]|nr:hypothetical protein BJ912DRAFT_1061920 [Pholiota molesta]
MIGPNPCGWCGQEGKCKTHLLVRPGKTPQILSDCEYHYAGLRYSAALTPSQSSPCTNVPIQCTICEKTFWKYNFIHHMIGDHLEPIDETLPPIPTALRLRTHISRYEEQRMGVEQELTKKYRDAWNILSSDGLQALEEEVNPQLEASVEHAGGQAELQTQIEKLTTSLAVAPSAMQGAVVTPSSSDARKRAYSAAAISIASDGSSYRVPPLAKGWPGVGPGPALFLGCRIVHRRERRARVTAFAETPINRVQPRLMFLSTTTSTRAPPLTTGMRADVARRRRREGEKEKGETRERETRQVHPPHPPSSRSPLTPTLPTTSLLLHGDKEPQRSRRRPSASHPLYPLPPFDSLPRRASGPCALPRHHDKAMCSTKATACAPLAFAGSSGSTTGGRDEGMPRAGAVIPSASMGTWSRSSNARARKGAAGLTAGKLEHSGEVVELVPRSAGEAGFVLDNALELLGGDLLSEGAAPTV